MEPRPHERGNDQTKTFESRNTHASMEPRPHERGNMDCRDENLAALCASMEPRPHERGNEIVAHQVEPVQRRFNGATSSRTWKLPVSGPTRFSGCWLQWSHVLTNVETLFTRRSPQNKFQASMEPRPHERGNEDCIEADSGRADRFNGATSSRTWKPVQERPRPPNSNASMEPRPHERGNLGRPPYWSGSIHASMEPRPHERGNDCHRRLCRHQQTTASMEPRPHERGNRAS